AVSPRLISTVGYGYFINDSDDFYGQETTELLRLQASPSHDPCVILIGSSTMREALSTVEDLEQSLFEETGHRILVHNLPTGGSTHWEARAIVDLLRLRHRGVALVEVSPGAIARPADFLGQLALDSRLLIEPPAWDEEIRLAGFERPERWGNFFIDHYRFF